jgi:predicted esterase
MDVLVSGKTSFKIEVPYRLIESGPGGEKPMIVYLHGFGQNLETFQKQMKILLNLNAYHLFIQGPYVNIGNMEYRGRWGYSWYIYNGKQGSFKKSLESSSEFIQGVIDGLAPHLKINRLCILGYSMGAYLGGYFAFSRYKHTNDLVMAGGRLKSEFLKGQIKKGRHIRVLSVHGLDDDITEYEAQIAEMQNLSDKGINATTFTYKGGHTLKSAQISEIQSWLLDNGYTGIDIKKM